MALNGRRVGLAACIAALASGTSGAGRDAAPTDRVIVPAGLVRGGLHGTAGRSCAFVGTEQRHDDRAVSTLRYDIPATHYAHKPILDRLDFAPERFGLWVRGSGDADLRIILRVRDGQGEEFNVWPDGGMSAGHEGWKKFEWSGGFRDSWGDRRNGKVDPPVTRVELFFIGSADRPCRGEIAFSTLTLEGPTSQDGPKLTARSVRSLPVRLRTSIENPHAVPIVLRVDVRNGGEAPVAGAVEVTDCPPGYHVTPIRAAIPPLAPGATHTVRFVPRGPGFNPYNRYEFRLRFRNEAGQATEVLTIAGARSAGVNLGEVRDSTTVPASPFGIGTHFSQGYDNRRSIPLLRAIGVKWVRDGLQVAEKDGQWALSDRSRDYLQALDEAGIQLCCIKYGPLEPERYADMMRYLVKEVGSQVKVWEIWNEPHNFTFRKTYGGSWNGVGDLAWHRKFVELVAAGSKAIRSADPRALIISGDDVPPNNYRLMQLGMGEHVDGLTIHPYNYGGQPPEICIWGSPEQVKRDGVVVADPDCSYASLVRVTRETAPGKQVWITEYGFVTPPTWDPNTDTMWKAVTEEAAAKYYARFYLLNFALGAQGIFQHTFQDGGDGPFGLVRQGFTPKPAYHVLGRLFGLLDTTWKRAEEVVIEFSGKPLPPNKDAAHPDQTVGDMTFPVKGGIQAHAWRNAGSDQVAVAVWNACWPEALRPPIGRTMKIRAPGHGHPIRIDLMTGEHPDCPPTRVGPDGTMIWSDFPVSDYPVIVKLFR